METETISSRNIVDLMLNDEFNGASLCGKTISATAEGNEGSQVPLKAPSGPPETKTQTTAGDFVYGWDC